MKKLISIIAALSMIASLGVTSFAAIDASISVTDAAKATLVKQDDGSFTADLAADSNASQDTIVVVKGDGSDISTTSIEYINQDAASQNFNFVLKNTPDAEEDFTEGNTLTYTVLMGGDTVSKTEVGTITYTYTSDEYTVTYVIDGETYDSTKTVKGIPQLPATTPTKDADEENTYAFEGWYTDVELTTAFDATVAISADTTVYGKFTATPIPGGDEGGEEADFTISLNSGLTGTVASAPYNVTNGKIIRITGLTTTDVVTVTVDGTPYTAKYYTTTDGEIVHVVALATATEITSNMISVVEGEPEAVLFGDATAKGVVDGSDALYITRCYAGVEIRGTKFALPTDVVELATWDANGDGTVDGSDALLITRSYAGVTIRGTQFTLPTMGAYSKK